MRRVPVIHLAATAFYTLLALLLTWPLAAHFTTRVPGDGIDDPALAWNLWWIKARLVDQLNPDIFHADWMFWPIGINLGFYTLTPLNGLLSIPLQTGFSLVVASNLILLSSFVLGGYGTFLLVRYLLGRDWRLEIGDWDDKSPISNLQFLIPAVCGIIYAFASSKLFYASLGQFNIASSQWIPFTVLYVLRTGERRRRQDAALAGLFLTFQAWAELTYATFLLIFIGLYLLWVLGSSYFTQPSHSQFAIRNSPFITLPLFLLLGLLFALGISPFLWAMLPDMAAEGDFFTSGGGFADIFSADLLGYLAPTRLHLWLGEWASGLPFPNDKGQHIFIGYSALFLAAVGTVHLLRRHRWRGLFWPGTTFLFLLLTLGPNLRIAGQATAIPGPFGLVSLLPFFNGNRYPSRYSVMLMLGVAVLVGYGVLGIRNWGLGTGRRRSLPNLIITSSLILLFFLEHLSIPLPLNDFRIPPVYRTIAAEPGDFAVLELPTGWRNGARVMGRSDVLIMMQQWYQTAHGKRLLGGNTSRNPAYKFQYFTDAPLIGDLIGLMNADQPHIQPVVEAEWNALVARNRAIAPAVLDFLDVGFVVLHVEKAPPLLARFVEEALPVSLVEEWRGADWSGAASTIRLYRVDERDTQTEWTVEPATPDGRIHLAEGWSSLDVSGRIRYAARPQPDLLLDIPAGGGTLTFDVYGPARLADVRLNGRQIEWVAGPLEGARQEIVATIPPGLAELPVDRLSLGFQDTPWSSLYIDFPTKEIRQPVGETGSFLPPGHGIAAVSAGEEVGDFAHIFLTNRTYTGADMALGERGYNLIAVNGEGDLVGQAAFDLLADPANGTAMAAWLNGWPQGTIIAGAVNDEASINLDAAAVMALKKLGVATDLRGRFRWSHAFVGAVGAENETAKEDASLLRPALAVVGLPVDGPQIWGGVGRIHFRSSR